MVPTGPPLACWHRGTDRSAQTTPQARSLPLSRTRWDGALGWVGHHCPQPSADRGGSCPNDSSPPEDATPLNHRDLPFSQREGFAPENSTSGLSRCVYV